MYNTANTDMEPSDVVAERLGASEAGLATAEGVLFEQRF